MPPPLGPLRYYLRMRGRIGTERKEIAGNEISVLRRGSPVCPNTHTLKQTRITRRWRRNVHWSFGALAGHHLEREQTGAIGMTVDRG
jgi:hypothetical protein